jgi:hypothetical protein
MKATLTESADEITYPFLGKSIKDELTILFTSRDAGTVMISNEHWNVGQHSFSWVSPAFKRLPAGSKITLEQE